MKKILFCLWAVMLFLSTSGVFAQYKTKGAFSSDKYYGYYVKDKLSEGMRVMANEDYYVIDEGDQGTYFGTNGGNPPCLVIWDKYLGKDPTLMEGFPESKKGYAYWIDWHKLNIIGDDAMNTIARVSIHENFPAQKSKRYTFYVPQSSSNLRQAQLIIRASDNDYDDDGDYTDFAISVNGNNLIWQEELKNQGLPSDESPGNISFAIGHHLKNGSNTLVLQNTETEGQVDYARIEYFEVRAGKSGKTTHTGAPINQRYYSEVRIGNQVWMGENLNVSRFRDGEPVPHAKTKEEWTKAGENKQPAWCYYENSPANEKEYGKLYNWYAVNTGKLCPDGWRIPTSKEWSDLQDYLNDGEVYFYGGGEEGNKMKERGTSHWKYPNKNATNESGFTALPGGERDTEGTYQYLEMLGHWWSITEDWSADHRAHNIVLNYKSEEMEGRYGSKQYGFSVRCIKE